jgi:hypothetical protein
LLYRGGYCARVRIFMRAHFLCPVLHRGGRCTWAKYILCVRKCTCFHSQAWMSLLSQTLCAHIAPETLRGVNLQVPLKGNAGPSLRHANPHSHRTAAATKNGHTPPARYHLALNRPFCISCPRPALNPRPPVGLPIELPALRWFLSLLSST